MNPMNQIIQCTRMDYGSLSDIVINTIKLEQWAELSYLKSSQFSDIPFDPGKTMTSFLTQQSLQLHILYLHD